MVNVKWERDAFIQILPQMGLKASAYTKGAWVLNGSAIHIR
jgi:hypothetical protein